MFDKIVNFYKEVKRLMDKKYEAQVEICKEVCDVCKEIINDPQNRGTATAVIAGAGAGLVIKKIVNSVPDSSTVGLVLIAVSIGAGVLGVGLMRASQQKGAV